MIRTQDLRKIRFDSAFNVIVFRRTNCPSTLKIVLRKFRFGSTFNVTKESLGGWTVHRQLKLFSRHEIDRLTDLTDCPSILQKKLCAMLCRVQTVQPIVREHRDDVDLNPIFAYFVSN